MTLRTHFIFILSVHVLNELDIYTFDYFVSKHTECRNVKFIDLLIKI